MLTELTATNFRSLHKASIRFSSTGLTVVVGANGSGKSNLIKCLEFLGAAPSRGMDTAVQFQGGSEAILPKALVRRALRSATTEFDYEVRLEPPSNYQGDAPPILVRHRFTISYSTGVPRVVSDYIRFGEPLRVQAALASEYVGDSPPSSVIEVSRVKGEPVEVKTTPQIDSETVALFLQWFGLETLKESLKHQPEVIARIVGQLLTSYRVARGFGRSARWGSLLDSSSSSLTSISPQARAFVTSLSNIRRYDLQLAELRKQQDVSVQRLTTHGAGLPGSVREVKRGTRRTQEWQELLASLREMAPHVLDTNVRALQSGQEFVQFVEQRTGRPVESWHESDGTLRALGILIALETHSPYDVILIEEPEQGLHPWAVKILVERMREVIRKRGIQVILTTHSQQVLDNVDPAEVRLATRTLQGGTTFASVEDVAPGHELVRGELGQLWVTGLLGAVPEPQRD